MHVMRLTASGSSPYSAFIAAESGSNMQVRLCGPTIIENVMPNWPILWGVCTTNSKYYTLNGLRFSVDVDDYPNG